MRKTKLESNWRHQKSNFWSQNEKGMKAVLFHKDKWEEAKRGEAEESEVWWSEGLGCRSLKQTVLNLSPGSTTYQLFDQKQGISQSQFPHL